MAPNSTESGRSAQRASLSPTDALRPGLSLGLLDAARTLDERGAGERGRLVHPLSVLVYSLCIHMTTMSHMDALSSESLTLCQSLDRADRLRIRQLASLVRAQETASLLTVLAPRLKPAQRATITRTCSFIHAGLLVFPAELAAAIAELPGLGVTPGPLVPSVVVHERLAARCAAAVGAQVWITHAEVPGARGRDLELFLAPWSEPALATLAEDERDSNRESHFALKVTGSRAETYQVREILAEAGNLLPDGGGYNSHENAAGGGRTVLYFRSPDQVAIPWPPRIELVLDGHHAQLLALHHQTADQRNTGSPNRPAARRPHRPHQPGDGYETSNQPTNRNSHASTQPGAQVPVGRQASTWRI